jgi:hypothetical protein
VVSSLIRATFAGQTLVDTILCGVTLPRRNAGGAAAVPPCLPEVLPAQQNWHDPCGRSSSLCEGRLSWNDARFFTQSALPRLAECSPQRI